KRAYCLKTQPATGETYPKSDLFNKALLGACVALIVIPFAQKFKGLGIEWEKVKNPNSEES
ncbi:hypothetical protein M7959_07750, partial [Enterobacter hormaechei subsp. xiangfangensis]|nr:hypothetical protein [Enterobacter hormaechei]MCW4978088.1 hypothetical protein [Enterobacter hormaechei subsp. xiangfangensis]